MSLELLVAKIKESIKADKVGFKNEKIQAICREQIASRDDVIASAAAMFFPLYVYYTKTKGIEPGQVATYLTDNVLWSMTDSISDSQMHHAFNQGISEEVRGQYRYIVTGMVNRKAEKAGEGVKVLAQDKDTGAVSEFSIPPINNLKLTRGSLSDEQNDVMQNAITNATWPRWQDHSDTTLSLSGYRANLQFKKRYRHSELETYDVIERAVKYINRNGSAEFNIDIHERAAIANKAVAMKGAWESKDFAYGHKVFRSAYLDQDALKVINSVKVEDTVKLYQFLTEPDLSPEKRQNRIDFFLTYRLLSDRVGQHLFKNSDVDALDRDGEKQRYQVSSLIDRDGSNIDVKQLLPLLGVENNVSEQRLSDSKLAQHLKGVSQQRSGGYIDLDSYMDFFRYASKEILPTNRANWKAFQSLAPFITQKTTQTAQPIKKIKSPANWKDEGSDDLSLNNVEITKPFWRQISKAGSLAGYMDNLIKAGLPRSKDKDTLRMHLADGEDILNRMAKGFSAGSSGAQKILKDALIKSRDPLDLKAAVTQSARLHESLNLASDMSALLSVDDPESVSWSAVMEDPVSLGGYTMTPILTDVALQREGRELHHCVGGYVSKCLQGKVTIVSIVNDADPQDRATLEITYTENVDNDNALSSVTLSNEQCRSFRNADPSKALSVIAKSYLGKINKQRKQTLNNYKLMQDEVSSGHYNVSPSNSERAINSFLDLVVSAEMNKVVEANTITKIAEGINKTEDEIIRLFADHDLELTIEKVALDQNENTQLRAM